MSYGFNDDKQKVDMYAKSEVYTKDEVYNKTQVDTSLSNKASAQHTHDDRYYTETEIQNILYPVNTILTHWGGGGTGFYRPFGTWKMLVSTTIPVAGGGTVYVEYWRRIS